MPHKRNIIEEIKRINDLNKIIQEQDFNSNDLSFRSGKHGYWSGNKTYPINPNVDYLSDIGARKRKPSKSPEEIELSNLKKGRKHIPLDINKKEDWETLIKWIINGRRQGPVTPETLNKINDIFPSKQYYGMDINNASLDGYDEFELAIVYYLLKAGKFKTTSDRLNLSKTFMTNVTDSDINPGCFKFKNDFNLTLDEFLQFVKTNYDKIEQEALDEFEIRLIERRKKKNDNIR